MANQSGKDPTVDLQALLARAKDIPIDITPMPIVPSLADNLHTLQTQVAQIMTVQLEKFEEIVGVVNSMNAGYKQLGSKVEKVQADMKVLKEKLAKNKVDKIQADQIVLQGRLEEVASSLRKMEECQKTDLDNDEDSESDGEEIHEGSTNSGDKSKTDSTCTQPIGETASTRTRTDESAKKSRQTVLKLNKCCNSSRDRIYPLPNDRMEETERIFPDTLAELDSNTSQMALQRLMHFYNFAWKEKTVFEMRQSIAVHIGIPQAVREKYLVRV